MLRWLLVNWSPIAPGRVHLPSEKHKEWQQQASHSFYISMPLSCSRHTPFPFSLSVSLALLAERRAIKLCDYCFSLRLAIGLPVAVTGSSGSNRGRRKNESFLR